MIDAILGTTLAEIRRAAQCPASSMVDRIRAHMREHLSEALTVVDLALFAGMSRAHCIRTYKAPIGKTPMADLRLLRVETARDQIITTVLPRKDITGAMGFCDESHLSWVFRKHFQVLPGYFQK